MMGYNTHAIWSWVSFRLLVLVLCLPACLPVLGSLDLFHQGTGRFNRLSCKVGLPGPVLLIPPPAKRVQGAG